MDTERIPRDFDKSLRGMKIVVAALVMGVLMFGCVTLLSSGEANPGRQSILAFLGLIFAAAAFIAREIASNVFVASQRKKIVGGTWGVDSQYAHLLPNGATTEEKLVLVYQSRLIIRAAILEGACFFNLVAFMIDHQWWSFAIAAVFAAINLSTIPSRNGLLNWIDQQIELMTLEPHSNS
jgi:hypothetical protein